eukprot:2835012-Pyramimonas_sp.AAC.1
MGALRLYMYILKQDPPNDLDLPTHGFRRMHTSSEAHKTGANGTGALSSCHAPRMRGAVPYTGSCSTDGTALVGRQPCQNLEACQNTILKISTPQLNLTAAS